MRVAACGFDGRIARTLAEFSRSAALACAAGWSYVLFVAAPCVRIFEESMIGAFSLRVVFVIGCTLMIAALCCSPPSAQESVKKHPVPPEKAQAKARELINDIFKDDLQNAKDPEAKAKLAAYLMQQGKESRDDATNRYVLYIEATALAAAAGDAQLALGALDELAKEYLVDLWKLKTMALGAAAESSPSKEISRAQVEML